jgi:hypothetical protein
MGLGGCSAAAATAAAITFSYSYRLGRSLYIPLTARCNSLTLPETRGPGFQLPAAVVSTLLSVRNADPVPESMMDHENRVALPPSPFSRIASLDLHDTTSDYDPSTTMDKEDGHYPLVKDLVAEVQQHLDGDVVRREYDSLVIAGEGEPTLRANALRAVAEAASQHRQRLGMNFPIRVVTNGLIHTVPSMTMMKDQRIVTMMKDTGVSGVSVALMTADPKQYSQLMLPCLLTTTTSDDPHGVVCDFIREALDAGLDVECTGVNRPEVDQQLAEELAQKLGVTERFRWRPYFP